MMAGEALLDAFINANILFCLGYVLWLGIRKAMLWLGLENAHGPQLKLLNAVFVAVVLAPVIALGFKTLQGTGIAGGVTVNLSDMVVSHYLNGGFEMKASRLEALILARDTFMLNVLTGAGWLAQATILVFLCGLCIGTLRLILSMTCLHRIVSGSFAWRRFGRLRIHLSDRTLVPFSTRGIFNYYVVIPSQMLSEPQALKVSLAHEFQHIRQGDLEWEVLLEVLKPLFYLNPAFHAWKRQVEALREFNCDSAVLSRGYIDTRKYCDTLLAVCQNTLRRDQNFAVAVPKVTLVTADRAPGKGNAGTSSIEHRILSLLEHHKRPDHRLIFAAISVPLLFAVTFASLAIQRPGDWSQDRLTLSTVVNLERLDEINRVSTFGRIGN